MKGLIILGERRDPGAVAWNPVRELELLNEVFGFDLGKTLLLSSWEMSVLDLTATHGTMFAGAATRLPSYSDTFVVR